MSTKNPKINVNINDIQPKHPANNGLGFQ